MMDICYFIHLFKPTECTTPRVDPMVNYRFGVTMMHQCRFILGHKCAILVSDADNGEKPGMWGRGGIWEISVIFSILL